ncbi:MAG TPA: hypothetical protein VKZ68_06315 [Ohtaekwangia sp.]|nr:hypothetical protein [Ohtaekwangia sp.]
MRTLKRLLLFLLILSGISCQEDSSLTADPANLSKPAREYLQMIATPGSQGASMAGVPLTGPFSRLFSQPATTGGIPQDLFSLPPWTTCATTTNTTNPDGSITTEVDYGDGCEEGIDPYIYFMHGKYAFTNSVNVTQAGSIITEFFAYKYIADNYGGSYNTGIEDAEWLLNWNGSMSGTGSRNPSGQLFWGTYTTTHEGESVFDGEAQTFTGTSRTSYTHKHSTIEESSATTRSGENYYHAIVLEPLVTRFDCDRNPMFPSVSSASWVHVPIYVSGREFVRYKQDGQEGSFTIFWGNGTCDSKLEIEENGVYYKLDWNNLFELFYQ